jgi:hypothetical protein
MRAAAARDRITAVLRMSMPMAGWRKTICSSAYAANAPNASATGQVLERTRNASAASAPAAAHDATSWRGVTASMPASAIRSAMRRRTR